MLAVVSGGRSRPRKMGKLDVETHRKAQRALLEVAGEGSFNTAI